MSSVKEIGHEAMWTVSSAKPGNGVECLRDGQESTFWSSEGIQPHFINIEFQTLTEVSELRIGLDYRQDESYTPSRVSIRVGPSFRCLREVRVLELEEPNGEVSVPLCWSSKHSEGTREDSDENDQDPADMAPIEIFCIQVAIIQNHQSGRDSHVRSVSVYRHSNAHSREAGTLGLSLGKQYVIR